MYGAEESYYRPRFRGNDDIISLMSAATSDTVNTINRTGENLAQAYGAMPRLLGAGVSGFFDQKRKAEERIRKQRLEDEDRAMRKKEFDLRTRNADQDFERGKLDLDKAKAEEDWYNTSYGPAGGMGPTLPGKGMTRRDVQREREMRAGELGLSQSEENIATAKAQRENSAKMLELQAKQLAAANASAANAAAANARAEKLFNLQLEDRNRTKAQEALGAALSMDAANPIQQPNVGPPSQSNVDRVRQEFGAKGMDATTLATLTQQARGAQAQNAMEQSLLRRRIDPGLATAQDQLTSMQQKMPQLTNLVGAVNRFKEIPIWQDSTPEAQVALQQVRSGIEGSSLDPVSGQQLAKGVGGFGDFSFSRVFSGQSPVQTSHDQAQQAVQNVLSNYEQQINALMATAANSKDTNMQQQAMALKAQLETYKQLVGAGANPATHNTWQPPQQQQATPNMFQRQGAPRMQPAQYDGRG